MGLFSASAPVVSVVGDEIFLGKAVGYIDRTGTIDMTSTSNPEVRCVGQFAYTGARSGRAQLRCSDGAIAAVDFNALSNLSGYGYGAMATRPVSFTYGLTVEEALKYLRFPAGFGPDLSGSKPIVRKLDHSPESST
jgi:hypothetical protein